MVLEGQAWGSPAGAVAGEEVLAAEGLAEALERLAGEIAERFGDAPGLVLVGVKRRGDLLARRLSQRLAERLGREVPVGSLDITLYRDDFDSLSEQPIVGQTEIAFPLEGRTVVLVDDVLFTGRTVRAALDELLDLGRPARIVLAVLIDRGGRELPICADIVGHTLAVEPGDQVQVLLSELDGRDAVLLFRKAGS
jgi:pyrimidine operon attenuation protein/uracil phosphoribosyltransferase